MKIFDAHRHKLSQRGLRILVTEHNSEIKTEQSPMKDIDSAMEKVEYFRKH